MILRHPLVTERLKMRTLVEKDVKREYLAWLRDKKVTRYLEVRFQKPLSLYCLRQFVRKNNSSPNNLLLGIYSLATNHFIGTIKLGPIDLHHNRTPIGFMIGERSFWGKGLAPEAIQAVMRHAFQKLKIEKITAGCYENNLGSRKALKKAGFRFEARIPNHVRYGKKRVASLFFGQNRPRKKKNRK